MSLKATLHKQIFHFGFNARTSRGAMKDKTSWFIKVWDESDPEKFGVGECGPLPGLSIEEIPNLDEELNLTIGRIIHGKLILPPLTSNAFENVTRLNDVLLEYFSDTFLQGHPAVRFAMETAVLDLANGGRRVIFENTFSKGKSIPINGLIWMGGLDFMLQQVEIKIRDGFRCVKLKVGGMDFEKECDILQYIRRKYFRDRIVIRLDANGAFKRDDVLDKLKYLSRYDIHSIEQPVKAGMDILPELCRQSPVPIALDEELIGVNAKEDKEKLLERIGPAFLILKPTLHGGMYGCQEWIELAEARRIQWWMTSALESNIGLNAISQMACNYSSDLPQGLGTGEIYTDNIASPLRVDKGFLSLNGAEKWDLQIFN